MLFRAAEQRRLGPKVGHSGDRCRRSVALGGMPIATAWSEFMQAARGAGRQILIHFRTWVGPIRRRSELFCVIQQLEAEMKAIFGAIFTSAMLLAAVGGASATSWIQASSTDEQLAADPKPKAVTMNSTDGKKN